MCSVVALADRRHVAQRLRRHVGAVADAAARDDHVVAAADRDVTASRAIMRRPRQGGAQRRRVGVADGDGQRVRRVVGPRQLGQRQQRLDHPLDLRLVGAAGAADRALDLLRRVARAVQPGTGRPPAAPRRAPVRPRTRSGRWCRSRGPRPPPRPAGARRSARAPGRGWRPAARRARSRGEVSITPPSSATRRPPARRDDAVARVGGAGIDAEDDHVHGGDSPCRAGRLPARSARGQPRAHRLRHGGQGAERPDHHRRAP